MKWFNILRDRLRALRQRETVIDDIDREMRLHLKLQVEANIKAGMSPQEARERAMCILATSTGRLTPLTT